MNHAARRFTALLKHPGFLTALLLALVIPPAVGKWLEEQLVVTPRTAALDRASSAAAASAAQAVADTVARWRARLTDFAGEPAALAALSMPATPQAAAGLRARFPEARAVQLVTRPDQLPLTDFLGRQLTRAVLAGSDYEVVAMKDDSQWRLRLAAPISFPGHPRGVALVDLPAELLASAVDSAAQSGKLILSQRVEADTSQAFLTLGSGDIAPAVARIPGAVDWQVTHMLSRPAAAAFEPPSGFRIMIVVGPWAFALGLLALIAARQWPRLAVGATATETRPTAARRTATPLAERETALPPAQPTPPPQPAMPREKPAAPPNYAPTVFRDYDIRGVSGTQITPAFATALGQSLGSLVRDQGGNRIAVARDGRNSSPALFEALIGGVLSTGCEAVDIGLVPTPVLCFAADRLPQIHATVMVTASHNPTQDNGFKITLAGQSLQGADLKALRERMLAGQWLRGDGERSTHDIRDAYLAAVAADVPARSRRTVVVDCGNGAAGELAPRLLETLGCTPVPLYCEIDGNFPHHPPDPCRAANLQDLRKVVAATQADLGIALDGDGDRLVAVSSSGRIVWPDELLMIFARDILSAHPGADVVYDVKSSRRLGSLISSYGGRPVMYRTGHSHIRSKTAELDAPLGGEFSGHIFFRDRWLGCDDALYAAARLLEILNLREQSLDAVLATLESSVATEEIRLPVPEEDKFMLVERIRAGAEFEDAKIIDIDGLRVELAGGWGLVRASNTEAAITLRFEAEDAPQLEAIRARFQTLLDQAAPDYGLRL